MEPGDLAWMYHGISKPQSRLAVRITEDKGMGWFEVSSRYGHVRGVHKKDLEKMSDLEVLVYGLKWPSSKKN